jgi:hypothetical protein
LIDADFDRTLLPANFTQGKTFRIVVIPGFSSNKGAPAVNKNDYNAVIKAYKIDDSHVKVLQEK